MAIFDSKNFNGNVFKQYVDRVPNLNRNELIKSRAIKKRQDIAQSMSDQVGGNYVTIPLARYHQRHRSSELRRFYQHHRNQHQDFLPLPRCRGPRTGMD